ncbi:MAG: CDP-glucose 4,6-dehydratase [Aestuariivirga sp.]
MNPSVGPLATFWKGKRVLVTGHTGFKGSWLTQMLSQLGAKVFGISLQPNTDPNLFHLAGIETICESEVCDIRDAQKLTELVKRANPEIILHLAAQPLVRASYVEPAQTFDTNVMGTVNLMTTLTSISDFRVGVFITTDKVYENREWLWPYREDDKLGGHDPYSASKAACEIAVASYRKSFFEPKSVAISTARAGNVIGGGDWSADRLLPDAMRAWQAGKILSIRNPHSIRPWQHVIEPLAAYLVLAETLWAKPDLAGPWNFGPATHDAISVGQLIELARQSWPSAKVAYGTEHGPHEASKLSLETSKAREILNINPRWDVAEAVRRTMDWHRNLNEGQTAQILCEADLKAWGF